MRSGFGARAGLLCRRDDGEHRRCRAVDRTGDRGDDHPDLAVASGSRIDSRRCCFQYRLTNRLLSILEDDLAGDRSRVFSPTASKRACLSGGAAAHSGGRFNPLSEIG